MRWLVFRPLININLLHAHFLCDLVLTRFAPTRHHRRRRLRSKGHLNVCAFHWMRNDWNWKCCIIIHTQTHKKQTKEPECACLCVVCANGFRAKLPVDGLHSVVWEHWLGIKRCHVFSDGIHQFPISAIKTVFILLIHVLDSKRLCMPIYIYIAVFVCANTNTNNVFEYVCI